MGSKDFPKIWLENKELPGSAQIPSSLYKNNNVYISKYPHNSYFQSRLKISITLHEVAEGISFCFVLFFRIFHISTDLFAQIPEKLVITWKIAVHIFREPILS